MMIMAKYDGSTWLLLIIIIMIPADLRMEEHNRCQDNPSPHSDMSILNNVMSH